MQLGKCASEAIQESNQGREAGLVLKASHHQCGLRIWLGWTGGGGRNSKSHHATACKSLSATQSVIGRPVVSLSAACFLALLSSQSLPRLAAHTGCTQSVMRCIEKPEAGKTWSASVPVFDTLRSVAYNCWCSSHHRATFFSKASWMKQAEWAVWGAVGLILWVLPGSPPSTCISHGRPAEEGRWSVVFIEHQENGMRWEGRAAGCSSSLCFPGGPERTHGLFFPPGKEENVPKIMILHRCYRWGGIFWIWSSILLVRLIIAILIFNWTKVSLPAVIMSSALGTLSL